MPETYIHSDSSDSSYISEPQPQDSSETLSSLSKALFWIMIGYFSIIFLAYACFFILLFSSSILPDFFESVMSAVSSLPQPVSSVVSFFVRFHLLIGVFLAFLNFAVSFASDIILKKSIKDHFLRLFPPVFKSVIYMVVLFLIAIVAGFIIGSFYPEIFENLFNLSGLPEGDSPNLTAFIFFNNTRVLFFLMMFGFVLAFIPVLIVLLNGFTIGFVSEYTIKNESLLFLVTGLLPHGIIELPVILLGAGVGFKLGIQSVQTLLGNLSVDNFREAFVNATWIFFLIGVPFLLIAALIEVFVTGPLLTLVP